MDSDFQTTDFENDKNDHEMTRFKVLEKKAHLHNDLENDLKSCCGGISDRRLILLVSQISFSGLLLVFCATVLLLDKAQDDRAVYFSLISSILSYWFGNQISMEKR